VNLRYGMAVLVSVGAAASAVAGTDASISLEPEVLLQSDENAGDLGAESTIDADLVRIRLSLHNHDGEELAWLEGELPREQLLLDAQPSRLALHTDETGAAWLLLSPSLTLNDDDLTRAVYSEDRSPLDLGPGLRVHIDRPTSLRDGGVSGARSDLDASFNEEYDRLYGFAGEQGRFDLYDVSLRWDALTPGPVTFSLIGGLKAIRTDVSEDIDEYDRKGNYVSTRLEDEYQMVPVPIIGGGVRWDVGDRFYLEGSAQTHTIPDGNTLLDVTAQTGIDFSPTVGLRAGYTYVRTAVELEQFDASLSQSGVFARIEISF